MTFFNNSSPQPFSSGAPPLWRCMCPLMSYGLFYRCPCCISGPGNIAVKLLSKEGPEALFVFWRWTYGFGMTWGWVINDRSFIFGGTNPLIYRDSYKWAICRPISQKKKKVHLVKLFANFYLCNSVWTPESGLHLNVYLVIDHLSDLLKRFHLHLDTRVSAQIC